MIGVYKIRCTTNGREYVGSSVSIENRFSAHINSLSKGDHVCKKLQKDWDLHGKESFEWIVITECDESILSQKETFFICLLSPFYNSRFVVKRPERKTLKAKQTVSLRLSPGLVNEINKRADAENRTFTNMVEVILMESFSFQRLNKALKQP